MLIGLCILLGFLFYVNKRMIQIPVHNILDINKDDRQLKFVYKYTYKKMLNLWVSV